LFSRLLTGAAFVLAVPELTRSVGIQLNDQHWLWQLSEAILFIAGTLSSRPKFLNKMPSGEHVPLGCLVVSGSLTTAIVREK